MNNNKNSIYGIFRCCLIMLLITFSTSYYASTEINKPIIKAINISKTSEKIDEQIIDNSTTKKMINIRGQVSFVGKKSIEGKVEDVIVYFQPNENVVIKPSTTPHQIKMIKKAYHPRVSAISIGSQIQISNHDTIIHNAFSPSKPNDFDLGLYGKSEGKLYKVNQPGVLRIFCNVHFHMVAYVLALDTPYFTQPDKNGFYSIENLHQGNGELIFWHERTEQVIKKISLGHNIDLVEGEYAEVNAELNITKRRVPEHKNKSGRSYKSKRRSRRSYN